MEPCRPVAKASARSVIAPDKIKIKSSADLCMYILDSTGVVTVAGESFGAPGYIRLSYATSDDIIIQATELIKDALKKLTF